MRGDAGILVGIVGGGTSVDADYTVATLGGCTVSYLCVRATRKKINNQLFTFESRNTCRAKRKTGGER